MATLPPLAKITTTTTTTTRDLAAARPSAPLALLEVRQGLSLHQLREDFVEGGVDAQASLVTAYGFSATRPELVRGWDAELGFESVEPYAFTDQDLPASVHLRNERRVSLSAHHRFSALGLEQRLSLGVWGRRVENLNSFAPPAQSFLFSANQTYLAPTLGYRAGRRPEGAVGWYAEGTLMPAVLCLLARDVGSPGWLYGLGGEAGLNYGVGPLEASLGLRGQVLRRAGEGFWTDWAPFVGATCRL